MTASDTELFSGATPPLQIDDPLALQMGLSERPGLGTSALSAEMLMASLANVTENAHPASLSVTLHERGLCSNCLYYRPGGAGGVELDEKKNGCVGWEHFFFCLEYRYYNQHIRSIGNGAEEASRLASPCFLSFGLCGTATRGRQGCGFRTPSQLRSPGGMLYGPQTGQRSEGRRKGGLRAVQIPDTGSL